MTIYFLQIKGMKKYAYPHEYFDSNRNSIIQSLIKEIIINLLKFTKQFYSEEACKYNFKA